MVRIVADRGPKILERKRVETTWKRSLIAAGWRASGKHVGGDEVGMKKAMLEQVVDGAKKSKQRD